MRARVLIVGNDQMLSTTRAMLLARFQTFIATPSEARRSIPLLSPEVMILCHTILDEQARRLIEDARSFFAHLKVLALWEYAPRADLDATTYDATTFEVQIGDPGALLTVVAGLLQGADAVFDSGSKKLA